MNAKLQDKAIKIQGKDYVLVKDRINFFNENYPNGSIQTSFIDALGQDTVVIKAVVVPDVDKPARVFMGYSQAVIGAGHINKTSALENCETSAVGRALAMMGIGVIDSVASVDEMNKAINQARQIPQNSQSIPQSGLTMPCKIHNVPMSEYISKKTGNPYFAHKTQDGQTCFGRKSTAP